MPALTATDLSALRKADQLYFRSSFGADGDISSHIECVKEIKKSAADPWAEDKTYRVPCEGLVYAARGWMGKHDDCEFVPHTASEHNGAAQYWTEWQTAVSMLRPGDILRLDWHHNGGSEEQERAGFCTDSLTLIVSRPAKGKAKARHFAFLLARHSTRNFPYVRGSWIPRETAATA